MEERHLILRKLLSEMHAAFPGISECTHNKLKRKKNEREREKENTERKKETLRKENWQRYEGAKTKL